MKSKIFLFSIILIFLFGCSKKKSKIEVLENNDAIYLRESLVAEKAKPTKPNFYKEVAESFRQKLKNILSNTENNDKFFDISYMVYINENGKVDKIRNEGVIDVKGKLHYFNYINEFTQEILPEISKWNFIPARINGNPVKSRKLIKLDFVRKDGKLVNMNELKVFAPEATFFVKVEQMPSPIGGIAGIQKRIAYPEIARKAGIQGRVFVKAFIDEKGNVVKTEIIKGIGGGCDKAASGAVKQTKFEPGRQKGKAVKVQVTVPILFRLQL